MKKFRKELITIILFLMICFVTVFLVNRGFLREEENQKVDSAATDESHFSEGYIEVGVHILAIDPLDEHINVELEFKPHGRFDQGDGLLSMPIEVLVSGVTNGDMVFAAGKRMAPVETALDFYQGEVENYPFDEHRALLEILVAETNSSNGKLTSVPTQLNFFSRHHNFQFQDIPLGQNKGGYIGYDLHMKRSNLVIGTGIFWMVIIWGLTIVNIILFTGVLMNKVKADFGLFGYMSGFIVALYFFRQMFPDIPPFLGVFSDYLSLFWAILAAAAIAIVVAIKWLIAVFKDEDGTPDSIG